MILCHFSKHFRKIYMRHVPTRYAEFLRMSRAPLISALPPARHLCIILDIASRFGVASRNENGELIRELEFGFRKPYSHTSSAATACL